MARKNKKGNSYFSDPLRRTLAAIGIPAILIAGLLLDIGLYYLANYHNLLEQGKTTSAHAVNVQRSTDCEQGASFKIDYQYSLGGEQYKDLIETKCLKEDYDKNTPIPILYLPRDPAIAIVAREFTDKYQPYYDKRYDYLESGALGVLLTLIALTLAYGELFRPKWYLKDVKGGYSDRVVQYGSWIIVAVFLLADVLVLAIIAFGSKAF